MFTFIDFLFDSIGRIFQSLQSYYFVIYDSLGVTERVSLGDLLVGFICMGLIISVFWRGART